MLKKRFRTDRIDLRAPVIALVIAAIAVPVELRPWGRVPFDLQVYPGDALENVAGFIPLGMVLSYLGLPRAVIVAALLSAVAETAQIGMLHRDPSTADIAANTIGAFLGALTCARFRIRSITLPIKRGLGVLAAAAAGVVIVGMWQYAGILGNDRGLVSPGTLEGRWNLNEAGGDLAQDSSGHGLAGTLTAKVLRETGGADGVRLDGSKAFVEIGAPEALRLSGSMTISAWINSRAFPADDAAIVSQIHGDYGYQLDTTIDKGPRTVGFKLRGTCGEPMARYGATALALNRWYHVAGVYDAGARTLDVYLNGKLDNGPLAGTVTATQHSSRGKVYIGRRSDFSGFEFAGLIRDVRIYSFALTADEIARDMQNEVARPPDGPMPPRPGNPVCALTSESDDARVPVAAASFGVLIGLAMLNLFPLKDIRLCLFYSLPLMLLIYPASADSLPQLTRIFLPVIGFLGAVSVAVSVRRKTGTLSW